MAMNESDNIQVLNNTLQILKRGAYWHGFHKVFLKLTQQEQSEAIYYSEDMVENLRQNTQAADGAAFLQGRVAVVNLDSFEAARCLSDRYSCSEKETGILVLNFANPVSPGGGVRRGAKAQEESLCRCSSLLMSLESEAAAVYYRLHERHYSWLSSDSMILSPKVEIIRDGEAHLLNESYVVSVLTCAAPIARYNYGEVSDVELQEVLYNRIKGMLCVAAANHYSKLVLGAWGCGAFGNDPVMVSSLFYKALAEFRWKDQPAQIGFEHIVFAVLDRTFMNAFSPVMKRII